jgi:uncharacterized protein YecE (DUF72 family)
VGNRIVIWRWQGRELKVFVYFDNNPEAAAPADAKRLIGPVGG